MFRHANSAEHKYLAINAADGLVSALYAWGTYGLQYGTSPFTMDQTFHHVAFVRRPDVSWSLHLDGNIIATGTNCSSIGCTTIETATSTVLQGVLLASGTTPVGHGDIRAARWSSVARYAPTGTFVPEVVWTPDAGTAMLVQLEEGAGNTVFDSGPAAQIGTISGNVQWVNVSPFPCAPGTGATLCGPASLTLPAGMTWLLDSPANSAPLFVFTDAAQGSLPLGPGGVWGTTQVALSPLLIALADPTNTFGFAPGLPATNAQGDWSLNLSIPLIPGLSGTTWYTEAYVMSFAAPNGFFFQSNLLTTTLN